MQTGRVGVLDYCELGGTLVLIRFAVNKFLSMIFATLLQSENGGEFTDWKLTGLAAISLFS
jgi:hypothetical protein